MKPWQKNIESINVKHSWKIPKTKWTATIETVK